MEKKIRLGIIFLITIIGIVFFVQYIAFNAQKNSRADTAPTISLSIEQGATQKVVIVKAKLSSGAVNIINYNFHVLFNTASTVTDITYSIGAASAGLGDSNGNLTAVNARTGTNRYIKIFGELGSLTPAPLSASYQEVVRITFDTNQTGTMISIPNDQNFTFTAYNPTTFVNTPLAITGEPFSLEGGTSSSSSSSSSSSNPRSSSSSSSPNSSSSSSASSDGSSSNTNSSSGTSCPTITKASIVPQTVSGGTDIMVKCNYGKDTNNVTVTGGGLTNCTLRYYDSNEGTVFLCKAPLNTGTYNNAECKISGSSCNSSPIGSFTVVSNTPHFQQRMRLPSGTYTLLGKVQALVVKGEGVQIQLICRSSTCFSGKNENAVVASVAFPESSDFIEKSSQVTIPSEGGNKDYAVSIAVQDGSEAYIDNVKMINGTTDYIINGEFGLISDTSANSLQPIAWGIANNKLGLYYGMAYQTVSETVYNPPTTSSPPTLSGPAVSVKLTMKIKFQGIGKKPANASPIKVKIKLGGRALSAPTAYQTGTFTPQDNGIWTGTVDFNVPVGGGYTILVKGPKHLQKKVCTNKPTENPAGFYHCSEGNVQLVAGNNDIDLSGVILLAGDLPAADGSQSGLIDTYDVSTIRQNFQTTDQAKIALGDLDLDGGITTLDWSLLVQSLGIKYDEE